MNFIPIQLHIWNFKNKLKHNLFAKNEHFLQSPFLFYFYLEVVQNPYPFSDFEDCVKFRKQLLPLQFNSIKHDEFLYRLINFFNFKSMALVGQINKVTLQYLSKFKHQNDIQVSDILHLSSPDFDFIYINNLLKDSLKKNLEQLINENKLTNTIYFISNIYQCQKTQNAWLNLTKHLRVTISTDFYDLGLLFVRPEHKNKEHFKLKL